MRRNPDASVPSGAGKTQYPLMKYLSLLLAVTLLFSGVTFARYLSGGAVYSSVGIAAFDATYSIDRVNATSFGNQDYYITAGGTQIAQGAGTAITVGITLKNNGDTAVHPTLHLEGPADYWNNIALQLTTSRSIAADSVLTPQFVISDIVDAAASGSFNTAGSTDYGSLGTEDATLGLTKSGGIITATWSGNTMTISAEEETRDYSVGFVREDDNGLLSPIYVDCEKEMTIYSIDIDLAALNVTAKDETTGTASEQRIVVWLTWTNDAPNNSTAANMTFWELLATETAPFTIPSDGDTISITGYHFDVSGIPVTDASGAPVTDANGELTGETTTVRVKQTFGVDENGNSQLQTEYFHVETIEGDDGAYAHPLTKKEGQESIYYCDNADSPVYVNLANIDDTFEEKDVSMIRYETDQQANITYAPIQQRAFGVRFSATFVQSSETP